MARIGNGVEIRDKCIRVKFVLNGETIRERLSVNGKSLSPTPPNRKYAERIASEIRRAIDAGNFDYAHFFPDSRRAQNADPKTLGPLLDLWLQACGQLAAATRDQYATAARFWRRTLGDSTQIRDLTHARLIATINSYPWPSPKTKNAYLIALRGAMALIYRGPRSGDNPLIGIKNSKVVKTLPEPLTAQERDAILDDMARYDPRIVAYFQFQFFTGMRPEETIALRWSDVDFNAQVVKVRRVRTFRGNERDGSKTNAERVVDLMPQARQAIEMMRCYTFLKQTKRAGKDEDLAADIFENPVTRKPWHDERSQRDHYWRPSLKRLGVQWRTPYNTRHTAATVALMAGVPPAYIAAQLGHSVTMLLTKYARWIANADGNSARDKMIAAMNSSQIRPKIEAVNSK